MQDTKNKFIPHTAFTYYFITSTWSTYCSFTQLFVIYIAFGQLDLLLFRLLGDLLANYITLSFYLHGKVYDPDLHAEGFSQSVLLSSRTGGEEQAPSPTDAKILPQDQQPSSWNEENRCTIAVDDEEEDEKISSQISLLKKKGSQAQGSSAIATE